MAASDKDTAIRSTCHCGNITVTASRLPEYINVCQCSICRRYGAAWGYYTTDEVKIETEPNAETRQYVWGDRDISFNFCGNCGCVCYWWPHRRPATDEGKHQMGLNTSNVNPDVLRFVDRKYEYSQMLAPLRSKDTAHPDDLAKY
ncbi:hypothetical protein MBLNU457_g2795t1 [Dothideomycetes sp. NU457]